MNRFSLLTLGCLIGFQLTALAATPTVSVLEPLDGTTIWGREVTVRWVAQDLPTDQRESGVHYHLFLKKGKGAKLHLNPTKPIGKSAIHTADQTYTFKNVREGDYTLFIVLADKNHLPLTPPVQTETHFRVVNPEKIGPGKTPDWLIFSGLAAIVLAVVYLNRAG